MQKTVQEEEIKRLNQRIKDKQDAHDADNKVLRNKVVECNKQSLYIKGLQEQKEELEAKNSNLKKEMEKMGKEIKSKDKEIRQLEKKASHKNPDKPKKGPGRPRNPVNPNAKTFKLKAGRKPEVTEGEVRIIITMYENHVKVDDIVTFTNYSKPTIYKVLRDNNITSRNRKRR